MEEKISVTKKGAGAAHRARYRGPLPGELIDDRYLLKDLLGHGGMGRVFAAKHLTLDEPCAVKVLKESQDYDEEAPERFLREARINAKLRHPNVVSITDAGVTPEGYHYLVMELLEGETLSDWIARHPAQQRSSSSEDIKELIGHLLGVCEGLKEAHRQNIVHRDIKPSNIYLARLTQNGETRIVPKLLDFGLSKHWDDHNLTKSGAFRGSLYYVSPEQAHIGFADARSDIFSMGAVLFHGLTGQTIFEENSQQLIIARLMNDDCPVPRPSEVNPSVPKALDEICLKALERNPQKRYQSVDEFIEALSRAPEPFAPARPGDAAGESSDHRGRKEAPPAGDTASRQGAKRPIIWALALLVILLGIGAVQYALYDKKSPTARISNTRSDPAPPRETVSAAANIAAPTRPAAATLTPIEPEERPSSSTLTAQGPRRETRTEQKLEANPVPKKIDPDVEKLVDEGFEAIDSADFHRADRAFERALKLSPRHAPARFGLGKSAYNRGEYARAVAEIEKALKQSDRPGWRLLLGQAHLAGGNASAAVEEWERVVEQSPEESKASVFAKRLIKKHAR